MEKLGLFKQEKTGNLVYYYLNKNSPFFGVVENIILKASNKKKQKELEKDIERKKNKNLMIVQKDDLDILFSKIGELENILESLSQKKSEIEDLINLGIVVNGNKEVLLIKRVKREKGKDGSVLTWAFPGGKQRINETRKECVAREVLAETGYKIEPVEEISLRLHPQFSVFIVYHLCRLVLPRLVAKPKEPHEIAEIRWVKPKEIKKLFTTDLDPKVSLELGLSKTNKK
ncbi:MAG: NUDIX hydrolase [Candidatus Nealsonbacteria bacterium]|nr:NUDIX hydrolase [Candidatus Nealsonbacteria bacterium]